MLGLHAHSPGALTGSHLSPARIQSSGLLPTMSALGAATCTRQTWMARQPRLGGFPTSLGPWPPGLAARPALPCPDMPVCWEPPPFTPVQRQGESPGWPHGVESSCTGRHSRAVCVWASMKADARTPPREQGRPLPGHPRYNSRPVPIYVPQQLGTPRSQRGRGGGHLYPGSGLKENVNLLN